jgi:hypothetical protein
MKVEDFIAGVTWERGRLAGEFAWSMQMNTLAGRRRSQVRSELADTQHSR